MPYGRTPRHAPVPVACRLVRVCRAVVQRALLALLHARQELARGRPIALQVSGEEHPWHVRYAREERAEACLRGLLVTPALHQDLEHGAVWSESPPTIRALAMDRQNHLIEVPLSARSGAPAPQVMDRRLTKRPAPLPDRFIRYDTPTSEPECVHIAIAQAEAAVQPDTRADALRWEAVGRGVIRRWCAQATSMAPEAGAEHVTPQVDHASLA